MSPARTIRLDPDALAILEEQRAFLRRSLGDLEREHDAGDLDDLDYGTLKDDYETRLSSVERAVEEGRAELRAAGPSRNAGRTLLIVAGVIVFAIASGVFVAHSAGRRDATGEITGNINQTAAEKNAACLSVARTDPQKAVQCYTSVLVDAPQNVEALTYRGWMRYLSGDGQGLQDLQQAVMLDSTYPDVHAFLAIVLYQAGCVSDAASELNRLDSLNPSPLMTQQVSQLRTQIQQVQSSSSASSCAADSAIASSAASSGP